MGFEATTPYHHQQQQKKQEADSDAACTPLLLPEASSEEKQNLLLFQHGGIFLDWLGRDAQSRPSLGGWPAAFAITVAFGLIYSAYFGIVSNLVIYLVSAWGATNASAASSVTNFAGTSFVCSFLGGFASDAYLGRLWGAVLFEILACASLAANTGAVIWIARSSDGGSSGMTSSEARTFFLVSLYMVAVAGGSTLPNLSSLGADQLSNDRDKAKYFTVVAMAISAGQVVGTTLVTYVESEMGLWGWGFGICAMEAAAGLLLLLAVAPRCRQQQASGNPILRVVQVLVAAVRKRSMSPPDDPSLLHESGHGHLSAIPGCRKLPHTNSLTFLDKAAALSTTTRLRRSSSGSDGASTSDGSNSNLKSDDEFSPWKLCTVTQVEELKCLLRVIPVGIASTCTAAMASQISTLFEEQAMAMNMQVTSWLSIPAASIHIFSIAGSILTGLVHNAGGARLLGWCINCRRRKWQAQHATSLQIQGVAILVGILCMIVSALVERYRLTAASNGEELSVLWLVPQTFLVGVSTNLVYAGSMDFFYTEVSDGMRTVSSSMSLLFLGAGNYLSSIFVYLVTEFTSSSSGDGGWIPADLNDGHVDYFYWFLAAFLTVTLALFMLYASFYTYRRPPVLHLRRSSDSGLV